MTRTRIHVVCLLPLSLALAGCAGPNHRNSGVANVRDLFGRVEEIMLVPGTDKKPSIIETQGFAIRARITFKFDHRIPGRVEQTEDVCYTALIDANSRVRFLTDGTFYLERGAIYVDHDCATRPISSVAPDEPLREDPLAELNPIMPTHEINAMYLPDTPSVVSSTQPTAPDDWVWVRTSRVEGGAEGSAIAVQIADDGFHNVYFLKGKYAYVYVDGQRYSWDEKSKFQEIDFWHTRREKAIVYNQADNAWLKGLRARVVAAGFTPF